MDAHDMPRAVNICFLFNALFLPPSVVSGILWERVLERGSFTAYSVMQTVSHYIPNRIELKDINTCLYLCMAVQLHILLKQLFNMLTI